jgi:hypothetical protein
LKSSGREKRPIVAKLRIGVIVGSVRKQRSRTALQRRRKLGVR